MGDRTVYIMSPLGARVMSQLGAFVANVEQFLEILTVPVLMLDGDTYEITGELFEVLQGAGTLQIANSPSFDDVVVVQTVTSWSDTSIIFSYDGTGLPADGLLYIKVTSDAGNFDTAATQAGEIFDTLSIANRSISPGASDETDSVLCGYDPGRFCSAFFDFDDALEDAGYGPADSSIGPSQGIAGFFNTTPGFYLVGATSGKVVEYGRRDHFYVVVSLGFADATVWCDTEGLVSYYGSPSDGAAGFVILYEEVDSLHACADTYGWTDAENVYLVPRFPVSVQITTPATGIFIADNAQPVTFSALAFAGEGDISSNIAWDSGVDGPLGTGATITPTLSVQSHAITVNITNAGGQARYHRIIVHVQALSIIQVNPSSGEVVGGTPVEIQGTGFTTSTTVEFGGVAATSVVYVDSQTLTCETPAGTGTVDVEVFDGADSDTLVAGFAYGANLSVISVTPDNGTSAGGTSVTITGTGFTADCFVVFDEDLADNIVFVNATTITCDTPAHAAGAVDVLVADAETLEFDVLVNGFTYT